MPRYKIYFWILGCDIGFAWLPKNINMARDELIVDVLKINKTSGFKVIKKIIEN